MGFDRDASDYNLLCECRVVLLVLFLSIVNRHQVVICVRRSKLLLSFASFVRLVRIMKDNDSMAVLLQVVRIIMKDND